ncbi:MAG TPA: hypothetical protein VIR63_01130 [Pontiella sp.]
MHIGKTVFSNFICMALLLGTGCQTTEKQTRKAILYPPAPSAPRLQYLTSYSVPSDLLPAPNAFKTFVLGAQPPIGSPIVKPYGLTVHKSKLYVCDTTFPQVHVLDMENHTWEYFKPKNQGKLNKVIGIAIDADGIKYIADPVRGSVVIYSPEGEFITSIGKKGEMKPVGVAVSDEQIHIVDVAEKKVHVYNKHSNERLFSIPQNLSDRKQQLVAPTNITLDNENNIYVSDIGDCNIKKFSSDGTYLKTIGSLGRASGQFVRNKGIAVDKNLNLYAVDAATQLVQIFNPEGRLLFYFGEPGGSPVPLTLPAGITIDYNNTDLFQPMADENFEIEYLVFVTSQYGPRKVSVYGFGKKVDEIE